MLEEEVDWSIIRATVMRLDDLELRMDETKMVIDQFREEYEWYKRRIHQMTRNHSDLVARCATRYERLKLRKEKQQLKAITPLRLSLRLRLRLTKAGSAVEKFKGIGKRIADEYLSLLARNCSEAKRKADFWISKLEEERKSSQIWTEKLTEDIKLLNLEQKPVETCCWEDVTALMRVTEVDKEKPLFFRGVGGRVGSKWVKALMESAYTGWLGVSPRKTVRKLVGGNLSIADEGECKGASMPHTDVEFSLAEVDMKYYPIYALPHRFQEEDRLDQDWPSPERTQNVLSLDQYEDDGVVETIHRAWDGDEEETIHMGFLNI